MARVNLSFFKVLELPVDPQPDAIYYVLDEDNDVANWYVTTSEGVAIPASDMAAVQNIIEGTLNTTTLLSYLDEDVTYNNNATLADTALSVTVEASGIYEIEAVLFSTSAAKGLMVDFGGTATITNFLGQWLGFYTDVDWEAPSEGKGSRITAAGTDFGAAFIDGAINRTYTFTGTVEINAAGTFLVRGAQIGANASDTSLLRGSHIKLTKLNPSGIVIPESDAVAVSALIDAGVAEALDAYSAEQPKVYRALLRQIAAAPVATVMENTLGAEIVWTREEAGSYIGTCSGIPFLADKTFIVNPRFYISEPNADDILGKITVENEGEISVRSFGATSGIGEDGWLDRTPIEFYIYP